MKKFFFLAIILSVSTLTAFTQARNEKLSGQIVCSVCWFEETDRSKKPYGNLADIECAKDCSDKDLGQSLAVREPDGKFSLYALEKGDFKFKGKDFLQFVPKNVEIEGELRQEKDKKFVKVNALKVIGDAEIGAQTALDDHATLSLKDMSGIDQDTAGLKGRFVVLNFWATWCLPCKKEMPDLVKVQNEYAPLGVQVIGATADEAADKPKVLEFVRQMKINFPVWLGAKTTDTARFGVGTVLPGTVIIDREGKIIWRKIGAVKYADLRTELDKLLKDSATNSAQAAKKTEDNSSLVPA